MSVQERTRGLKEQTGSQQRDRASMRERSCPRANTGLKEQAENSSANHSWNKNAAAHPAPWQSLRAGEGAASQMPGEKAVHFRGEKPWWELLGTSRLKILCSCLESSSRWKRSFGVHGTWLDRGSA